MPQAIDELTAVMKKLRSPEGCPWDREQTHRSLMTNLMGECAEVLDAIAAGDDANLCEELGDVLMQIVLHAVIAEERGAFTFDDVVRGITLKMLSRHPHVFGTEKVASAKEVANLWEKLKAKEKAHAPASGASILDGVPDHCPALLQAEKAERKAAKVGFDWTRQEQIVEKIGEEYRELRAAIESGDEEHIDEELGDLLFAVTNLSRFRARGSAELLLARSTKKFKTRFARMEQLLSAAGKKPEECTPEEWDELWNRVKGEERAAGGE